MKVYFFAICIAVASAGSVDFTSCVSAGRVVDVRIQDCEGPIALMQPGTPYITESDIIPAEAAVSLRLKVTAVYLQFPILIIDTQLENSTVRPGEGYTIRFTITPNDLLSGNTLPVSVEVSDNDTERVEGCVTVIVKVL